MGNVFHAARKTRFATMSARTRALRSVSAPTSSRRASAFPAMTSFHAKAAAWHCLSCFKYFVAETLGVLSPAKEGDR